MRDAEARVRHARESRPREVPPLAACRLTRHFSPGGEGEGRRSPPASRPPPRSPPPSRAARAAPSPRRRPHGGVPVERREQARVAAVEDVRALGGVGRAVDQLTYERRQHRRQEGPREIGRHGQNGAERTIGGQRPRPERSPRPKQGCLTARSRRGCLTLRAVRALHARSRAFARCLTAEADVHTGRQVSALDIAAVAPNTATVMQHLKTRG